MRSESPPEATSAEAVASLPWSVRWRLPWVSRGRSVETSGSRVVHAGRYVVRWPADDYHRLRFADEPPLLSALAGHGLPAEIPRPIYFRLDPAVIVYRRDRFARTVLAPGRADRRIAH